jgi:hypothetical protein
VILIAVCSIKNIFTQFSADVIATPSENNRIVVDVNAVKKNDAIAPSITISAIKQIRLIIFNETGDIVI